MRVPVYRQSPKSTAPALERVIVKMALPRFLARDIFPAVRIQPPQGAELAPLGGGYFAERRRGRAVRVMLCSDVQAERCTVPIAEKLFILGDELYHLDVEGRVTRSPSAEVRERFEGGRVCGPPSATMWPVPFPPIAIVVAGAPGIFEETKPVLAEAAPHLVRPAYALKCLEATYDYRKLAGVPLIRSTALITYLEQRTVDGIFHPDRAPRKLEGEPGLLRLLFGVPHRAWRDLAELTKDEA